MNKCYFYVIPGLAPFSYNKIKLLATKTVKGFFVGHAIFLFCATSVQLFHFWMSNDALGVTLQMRPSFLSHFI